MLLPLRITLLIIFRFSRCFIFPFFAQQKSHLFILQRYPPRPEHLRPLPLVFYPSTQPLIGALFRFVLSFLSSSSSSSSSSPSSSSSLLSRSFCLSLCSLSHIAFLCVRVYKIELRTPSVFCFFFFFFFFFSSSSSSSSLLLLLILLILLLLLLLLPLLFPLLLFFFFFL
jgi:hypothetical protein